MLRTVRSTAPLLWASLSFIVASFFVAPRLGAATVVVPDQVATIQAAIIHAAPGDSVLVRAGTYPENIKFLGKAITVLSEVGPAATIIDGSLPASPDSGTVAGGFWLSVAIP